MLRVLSCRRLRQTQVESVSYDVCLEDVVPRETPCSDTILRSAEEHSVKLRYVAASSPDHCHLPLHTCTDRKITKHKHKHQTVKFCQDLFGFELPSVLIVKRRDKFLARYKQFRLDYSLIL